MADMLPNIKGDGGCDIQSLPVMAIDCVDAAKRAGMGFIASTSVQTVGSANYMAAIIANPLGSGKRLFLSLREFTSNQPSAVLEYQAYVNPTASLANLAASANMMIGDTTTAVGSLHWGIAASFTMGGVPASGGFIPLGGEPRNLPYLGILNPGTSLGYVVQGEGGGALQNQARIALSFFWHEEVI